MFDIGMQELVVVFLVALIVLGPQKIPATARQLGKAFVQLKKLVRDFKIMVQESLEEEDSEE